MSRNSWIILILAVLLLCCCLLVFTSGALVVVLSNVLDGNPLRYANSHPATAPALYPHTGAGHPSLYHPWSPGFCHPPADGNRGDEHR